MLTFLRFYTSGDAQAGMPHHFLQQLLWEREVVWHIRSGPRHGNSWMTMISYWSVYMAGTTHLNI